MTEKLLEDEVPSPAPAASTGKAGGKGAKKKLTVDNVCFLSDSPAEDQTTTEDEDEESEEEEEEEEEEEAEEEGEDEEEDDKEEEEEGEEEEEPPFPGAFKAMYKPV